MVGRAGIAVTVIEPLAGTDEAGGRDWPAPAGLADARPGRAGRTRRSSCWPRTPTTRCSGSAACWSALAGLGAGLRLVWATDGEASHPGSTAAAGRPAGGGPPGGVGGWRPSGSALAAAPRVTSGCRDGGLAGREDELAELARDRVPDGDVVLAPWSGDGHPDHEACGRAAAGSSRRPCCEYPVWAWHWAEPDDDRVPW